MKDVPTVLAYDDRKSALNSRSAETLIAKKSNSDASGSALTGLTPYKRIGEGGAAPILDGSPLASSSQAVTA
jgi:hypothetical protein